MRRNQTKPATLWTTCLSSAQSGNLTAQPRVVCTSEPVSSITDGTIRRTCNSWLRLKPLYPVSPASWCLRRRWSPVRRLMMSKRGRRGKRRSRRSQLRWRWRQRRKR
ncbi:hypothetical protein L3Q82_019943, partial [Scortum barcoo]